jgi:hypothetical protein
MTLEVPLFRSEISSAGYPAAPHSCEIDSAIPETRTAVPLPGRILLRRFGSCDERANLNRHRDDCAKLPEYGGFELVPESKAIDG